MFPQAIAGDKKLHPHQLVSLPHYRSDNICVWYRPDWNSSQSATHSLQSHCSPFTLLLPVHFHVDANGGCGSLCGTN